MEIELLKQKIEFMQFEMEDLKHREQQQKTMYETMLRSFTEGSKHETDVSTYEQKFKELQETIKRVEREGQERVKNAESKQESQKIQDQKEISRLNDLLRNKEIENQSLLRDCAELRSQTSAKSKEVEKEKKRFEKAMSLMGECEYEKSAAEAKLIEAQTKAHKDLTDLQNIYEAEKQGLQTKMDNLAVRLTSNNLLVPEIEEVLSGISRESIVKAFKSCETLKNFVSTSVSVNEDVKSCIFCLLELYQSLASGLEKVTSKNPETEYSKLNESVSAESFDTQSNCESSRSRKVLDSKYDNESYSKPPARSSRLKHGRSRTLFPVENSPYLQSSKENHDSDNKLKQCERMVTYATSMECEFCKFLFPTCKFYEHLMNCMNEVDTSNTSENRAFHKIERMEQQINDLKFALGKLKNQRDKARINSDKLLLSLKKAKLELAVSEENSGQRQMELKNEIKHFLVFMSTLKSSISLPSSLVFEIDQFMHRSSRIFGGKIAFR